jgi:hypothetical protein
LGLGIGGVDLDVREAFQILSMGASPLPVKGIVPLFMEQLAALAEEHGKEQDK